MFRSLLVISWLSFSSCQATTPAASVGQADRDRVKREVLTAFERLCDLRGSNSAPRTQVATPLEPPPTPPPGAQPEPLSPGVFLELALFTTPRSVANAKDLRSALAKTPTARFIAAPHVLLEFGRTVILPFDEHTGPLTHTTLRAIEGTATVASDRRLALELSMILQLPTPPDAQPPVNPTATRVRFVLGLPARQVVAATAAIPGWPDESAVVLLVAHVIREDSDLRALFECRMRERQR